MSRTRRRISGENAIPATAGILLLRFLQNPDFSVVGTRFRRAAHTCLTSLPYARVTLFGML